MTTYAPAAADLPQWLVTPRDADERGTRQHSMP